MLSYAGHRLTKATRNTNVNTQISTGKENMDVQITQATSDTIWEEQWWSRHGRGSLVGTSEYNIIHTGQLHNPLKQLSSGATLPKNSDIELDVQTHFLIFLFPTLVLLQPPFVTWELLSNKRQSCCMDVGSKSWHNLHHHSHKSVCAPSQSKTEDQTFYSTHGHFQGSIVVMQIKW